MIPLGVLGSARVSAAPAVTYRAAVLADSPYCYFPLDDAATPSDVMGRVTPSSVAGVTLGAAGIGDGATAAAFDGGATTRGILLPDSQLPPLGGAFTLEVLAKATDMNAQRALFGREQQSLLRHTATAAVDAFTGSGGWANRVGSAGYAEAAPTTVHHWALVWDGATVYLYRDGAVVLSEAAAGAIAASAQHLYIGSRLTGDLTFLGTLAGFAYHTTGLPSARILAHAQAAGLA